MSDSSVVPVDNIDSVVLLSVLEQAKAGDFAARMPLHWTGLALAL